MPNLKLWFMLTSLLFSSYSFASSFKDLDVTNRDVRLVQEKDPTYSLTIHQIATFYTRYKNAVVYYNTTEPLVRMTIQYEKSIIHITFLLSKDLTNVEVMEMLLDGDPASQEQINDLLKALSKVSRKFNLPPLDK